MFTVCPKCKKQFRLYAEHIAAAAGQVRCGFCDMQFNALEHLHDEPLSDEKISKIVQPEPKLGQDLVIESEPNITPHDEAKITEPESRPLEIKDDDKSEQLLDVEPEFNIPEINEPGSSALDNGLLNTNADQHKEETGTVDNPAIISEPEQPVEPQSDPDLIISKNAGNTEVELDTAIHEIGIEASNATNKVQAKDDVFEENRSDPIAPDSGETQYDFPDEDEGLFREPVKRRWISTFFWTSACFIGVISITLQLGWFNRDLVLMKYPQLTPYVKQLCNELDCRIMRHRNTQAIKLVNRDVRLHPNYQDSLLVNATMSNELSVRQPYPRVQLTLFDTSGALLGHRQFFPDDYLDDSIDLDAGMPINIPVHFVLEVSGPTAGAVSFEFRFL